MKAMKIAQRMKADQTGSMLERERSVRPMIAPRRRPPRIAIVFLEIAPAIATRDTPIIRVVFAVTDPIALPIAS